jgi:5-methylcytosine-specific restriction endonuclease McrA
MYLGRVHVIETYPNWIIRSERVALNVPSICVTKEYFPHKHNVKFSRYNLYLRDLFKCQYCGEVQDYDELTIDHVLPRTFGGKTTWENCTTSCKSCNHAKGSKTNIKPLVKPYKPDYYQLVTKWRNMPFTVKQESWNQYLGVMKLVA